MLRLLRLLFLVLFLASSSCGVWVLIVVEDFSSKWHGLAEIDSQDGENWTVSVKSTELGRQTSSKPASFSWPTYNQCQIQFIRDRIQLGRYPLSGWAVENYWIPARIAKLPQRELNSTKLVLQVQKKVVVKNSVDSFTGYETTSSGILFTLPEDMVDKFKELFATKTIPRLQLVKDTSLAIDLQLEATVMTPLKVGANLIILFNCFDVVHEAEQHNMDGTTTTCYIKFWSRKAFQYAIGKMSFTEANADGTLWIEKIWSHKKGKYYEVCTERILLLRGADTFTIAVRDASTSRDESPDKLLRDFMLTPTLIPSFNKRFKLMSDLLGFNFDFGKMGIISYDFDGQTKELPVRYDVKSKTLTFLGKEVIETFDKYRLRAEKVSNDGLVSRNALDNTYVVMTLLDMPAKCADSVQEDTAMAHRTQKISIYGLIVPSSSGNNIFKYPIFQYNYNVLKAQGR